MDISVADAHVIAIDVLSHRAHGVEYVAATVFGRPDLAATGKETVAAHVHPAFQEMPSRVETNSKPLMVTLRATGTRVDAGYTATRFVFTVDPPNDEPRTLCDGAAPTCSLPLDGSRRQAGTWIITVQVYDNTGNSAEIRTRLRVV